MVASISDMPDADELARQTVTVEAGTTSVVDLLGAAAPGTLIGAVAVDGAAADEALVQASVHAPQTCAEADFCHWVSEDGASCHCVYGSEELVCTPAYGGCRNISSPSYWAVTSTDGRYSVSAPAGIYDVDVYSGRQPGQGGMVRVSTAVASVAPGETVDLGTTSYVTGLISGAATTCGYPLSSVSITARNLDATAFSASPCVRCGMLVEKGMSTCPHCGASQ